jgi:hypothetical protein
MGGAGIDLYRSTESINQLREQVVELAACLPEHARGMVTSPFIGLIPPNKIATDRIPPSDAVDYYLFSTDHPSYEVGPDATRELLGRLESSPAWVRLGKDCQPSAQSDGDRAKAAAFLFVKR